MSKAYQNYLEVREIVRKMLENQSTSEKPSSYWLEELAGFDYMLDASPLIIEKLRRHTHHITGLRDYEYRNHHSHQAKKLEVKLKALKAVDKHNLLVVENPALGGFGYEIDGKLYNYDTLKFYESLIAMDKAGLLPPQNPILGKEGKGVVLEIGSGWGGLAYQFKTLFPRTTYVLVDLPEVFIFSATYLKTLFPEAKILMSDGLSDFGDDLKISDYDFVFIPHYFWWRLNFRRPDLIVNLVSFQEMTTAQVESYIKKAAAWGVPALYSWNRDHSPNNSELGKVSEILSKYYAIKEIEVLPKSESFLASLFSGKTDDVARRYRHLAGYNSYAK